MYLDVPGLYTYICSKCGSTDVARTIKDGALVCITCGHWEEPPETWSNVDDATDWVYAKTENGPHKVRF